MTVKRLTVRMLADAARVSVRTLHHYDEIGLLKPAWIGSNGYRYYEQAELYRLQQILLYREFGMSLEDIRRVLDDPGFDAATALKAHRLQLERRIGEQERLLEVIDETLLSLEGKTTMTDETLYAWHSEAKQAEFEAWLVERYGPEMQARIDDSRARFNELDEAGRKAALAELETIETDLLEAFRRGIEPGTAVLKPILKRHNDWVAYMWGRPCPPQAYAGLGQMYSGNPEFIARFDAMAEGFSGYLSEAIAAYAAGLSA
ncbi:MAG: MerR family transcriptional regulator [Acidobacteria bacterium]|nr:MerR family transcriptional regulator [Acidobacteriota bacterium]